MRDAELKKKRETMLSSHSPTARASLRPISAEPARSWCKMLVSGLTGLGEARPSEAPRFGREPWERSGSEARSDHSAHPEALPLRAPEPSGDKRRLSLALQGGGAFGAFTWGVLDRLLEEDDLELDAISGASAGAINAVLLASGLAKGGPDEARASLERFWSSVGESARRTCSCIPSWWSPPRASCRPISSTRLS